MAGGIEGGWHNASVRAAEEALVGAEPDFLGGRILHNTEHGASVQGNVCVASIRRKHVQAASPGADEQFSVRASAVAAEVVGRVGQALQIICLIQLQAGGIQHMQALVGKEPQFALAVVEEGLHLAHLAVLQTADFPARQTGVHETGVGVGHPDSALAVRHEVVDAEGIVLGAAGDAELAETPAPAIEGLHSGVEEGGPDGAVFIRPELLDHVGTEAAAILLGIVAESASDAIPDGDAAAVRAYPEPAFGILAEGADYGVAQAAGGCLEIVSGIAVASGGVCQFAAVGSHPDASVRILEKGPYGIGG